MHRFIWKSVSESLVGRNRAPPPSSSQICSSLQSLRLLSSISTSDSDTDDSSGSDSCTEQEPSTNGPSSVLRLFQDCGFSQIQAESIVSRYPILIRSDNPEKTFKPKITFFHSIGIPEADVAKMVARYPLVLRRSLNNRLIPTFDFLKSLLGGEDNAISLVKSCPSVFYRYNPNTLAVNLAILRKHGVPESDILKMLTRSGRCAEVMLCAKPDWFSKVVQSVMKMGFNTSTIAFGNAVTAMGLCTESTWEEKLKFYQSLGFSREEVFSMFRKQPISLWLSQKKVREAAEFYSNKFHWGPSELAMRPILLMYSLHNRIIPRSSVLQILWSRNRIRKCVRLLSVLCVTDGVFVEKYVTKYQGEVPEVLDAYQGKLHFDEFTFDSRKNEESKAI